MDSPTRVLAAAPTEERAVALASQVSQVYSRVDLWAGGDAPPAGINGHRLLFCELGRHWHTPDDLLRKARPDAHVVLLVPKLDPALAARLMHDRRVNHLIQLPMDRRELKALSVKLATGQIFGMSRYLKLFGEIHMDGLELATYDDRCRAIDSVDRFAARHRVRGQVRRNAVQVLEEMLMNAMYQAPVDDHGHRLFAGIDPQDRVRHPSPRAVTLRYAALGKTLCLRVRDRFGSFRRNDMVDALRRCTTSDNPIQDKASGAGLGLYLMASHASWMVVNCQPNRTTEFICILQAGAGQDPLRVLSTTFLRPATPPQ